MELIINALFQIEEYCKENYSEERILFEKLELVSAHLRRMKVRNSNVKMCNNCYSEYPKTEEYFKPHGGHLYYICRDCVRDQRKVQKVKDRENLTDRYVRHCLKKIKKFKNVVITDEMIKEKRLAIIKINERKAKRNTKKDCVECNVEICNKNIYTDLSNVCRHCYNNSTRCLIPNPSQITIENNKALSIRLQRKKMSEELYDSFVTSRIQSNLRKQGFKISRKDVPQDLIDLKRKQLKLIRICRKKQ